MSTTHQLEYHLYSLYDRAFEDCIALLTVSVPDDYKEHCPKEEDVQLLAVSIQKDTADYLVGTYHTDINSLCEDIKKNVAENIYETFVEEYGESIEDDEFYEEWAETATPPKVMCKPIEVMRAEELFGDSGQS